VRDCPHISNKPIIEETLLEVKNSCAVAVDILNDLLLYEKFDDGIFSLARTEMKIADYFVEAVSVYKVQARSSAITFDIHTRNVDDVIVHIDVTKFSQVLRNLLSNALKFTPKGGKVDVSCYTIPLDHQEKEPIHFAKVPAGVKEQFETLLQLREFKATTKSLEALPSMDDLGFVRICVKDSGAGISEVY
jgi:signal transduction histidine kinase